MTDMPLTSLQQQLLEYSEQCFQQAESQLNQQFPRPEISFTLRGKSAGSAHLQTNRLRFNPILLEQNRDDFINEVVPHEISHLLCYQLYGAGKHIKPHGIEWQAIMKQVFALPPRASHRFDVSSVSGQTFSYQCHCGITQLSIRRHNKVQRGTSRYLCRQCQQELTPINIGM